MATAKRQQRQQTGTIGRGRRFGRAALLLLAVAMAAIVWLREPILGKSRAAAAYGARVACSCRFVAGRPLDACRKDFLPGMGPVTLSEDTEARSVTARYLLVLASDTARLRPGQGCMLDRRKD